MTRTLAYLDPGSSGIILQVIGGGLAAVAVAVKIYGRRILQALHLRRRQEEAEPPARSDSR
jgi:hypothetical protein